MIRWLLRQVWVEQKMEGGLPEVVGCTGRSRPGGGGIGGVLVNADGSAGATAEEEGHI